jgi:hypothetical protein
MDKAASRKKRTDRNHVIYLVTCVATGDTYVGLTVCTHGTTIKGVQYAVDRRFQKHVCRATSEQASLPLCEVIRQYGKDFFQVDPLWIVRGKEAAHEVERKVIAELKPVLNVCLVK